jgi:plastocyanin
MADQIQPIDPDEANRDVEESKERAWHEWMGIAVGLTSLLSIMAIILSVVAVSASSSGNVAQAAPMASANSGVPSASAVPVAKPEAVKLAVKADVEHARRGPDGKWHDAFLPADFTVHAGAQVTVTVTNYDSGPHTFTSPSLGVNAIIPGGGTLTAPHQMTFTFTAPKKAGKYQWWCAVPCDPWSMAHNGYMRGFVTVAA